MFVRLFNMLEVNLRYIAIQLERQNEAYIELANEIRELNRFNRSIKAIVREIKVNTIDD